MGVTAKSGLEASGRRGKNGIIRRWAGMLQVDILAIKFLKLSTAGGAGSEESAPLVIASPVVCHVQQHGSVSNARMRYVLDIMGKERSGKHGSLGSWESSLGTRSSTCSVPRSRKANRTIGMHNRPNV